MSKNWCLQNGVLVLYNRRISFSSLLLSLGRGESRVPEAFKRSFFRHQMSVYISSQNSHKKDADHHNADRNLDHCG